MEEDVNHVGKCIVVYCKTIPRIIAFLLGSQSNGEIGTGAKSLQGLDIYMKAWHVQLSKRHNDREFAVCPRANSYCDNVASPTIGQWRLQWNLIGTKFWPVSLQFLSCPLVPSSSSDLNFPFHGHLYFSTFYPLRCFWRWKLQMNMFKVTNSLYKTLYFSPALGTSSDLNFPFHFSTLYSLECFTERETLQLHWLKVTNHIFLKLLTSVLASTTSVCFCIDTSKLDVLQRRLERTRSEITFVEKKDFSCYLLGFTRSVSSKLLYFITSVAKWFLAKYVTWTEILTNAFAIWTR